MLGACACVCQSGGTQSPASSPKCRWDTHRYTHTQTETHTPHSHKQKHTRTQTYTQSPKCRRGRTQRHFIDDGGAPLHQVLHVDILPAPVLCELHQGPHVIVCQDHPRWNVDARRQSRFRASFVRRQWNRAAVSGRGRCFFGSRAHACARSGRPGARCVRILVFCVWMLLLRLLSDWDACISFCRAAAGSSLTTAACRRARAA